MSWTNIRLIVSREVRDQLRDRRTVFTIVVLPLLLYPLLGTTFLQMAQFLQEHPTRVLVLGAEHLPAAPPLLEDGQLAPELEQDDRLLELDVRASPSKTTPADVVGEAQRLIEQGKYDAVVYFPENFRERLEAYRARSDDEDAAEEAAQPPSPQIYFNAAKDKSRIAHDRVTALLRRWRELVVQRNLERHQVPASATEPFELALRDMAPETGRRAVVWSKILPFVVLIWALTGAFYPAVDLCAGEKERGTLETLLCSPARRSEIVWGKLLTVMIFSMATSLLNLASMGVTGAIILRQVEAAAPGGIALGAPPLLAVVWLLLALVPIAALFSALALAIAAFARSSKEGQYYLMPLLMITLPLMMLPMFPGAELDLGSSLIPVTGVMLLLKALIEGEYAEALLYAPPVILVTAGCCLLAIRWAVDQFNNESVLFRESERFGLVLWARRLVRDREDTPTFGQAILCGVLLLSIRFFASFLAAAPETWTDFAVSTLVLQVALIATPVLLMTIVLTRSPKKTLLLTAPRPLTLPAAVLLAIALHPLVVVLSKGIQMLYPLGEGTREQLTQITSILNEAPLPYLLLVLAVVPAICEELAFRGFILSGLRHLGHRRAAIVISSIFFGVTHGVLQQSLSACAVGVILGYLAIQTGSLLPCILFHMTHNSLAVLAGFLAPDAAERPWAEWMFQSVGDGEYIYSTPVVALGGAASLLLLMWLRGLPHDSSPEERRQHALEHQTAGAAP
ncbi:MAG: ABC transporter permease subunit [Planctomycetes bacterium]|nr:ABC transporter permease subunit [Planctomycetota bacterium]